MHGQGGTEVGIYTISIFGWYLQMPKLTGLLILIALNLGFLS
jgi:hypothetical protein